MSHRVVHWSYLRGTPMLSRRLTEPFEADLTPHGEGFGKEGRGILRLGRFSISGVDFGPGDRAAGGWDDVEFGFDQFAGLGRGLGVGLVAAGRDPQQQQHEREERPQFENGMHNG